MAISTINNMLTTAAYTAAAATAGEGTAPDRHRLYSSFGERIATLEPQLTPLFTYTTMLGSKVPASDPVFRFLEDRVPIQSFNRTFLLAADVNAGSAVTANNVYPFSIDKDGASVDWLGKGMTFIVRTLGDTTTGYAHAQVQVDSDPSDAGSTTSFDGRIVNLSESSATGEDILSNNDECRVVGTSFAEGTGPPDAWQELREDNFGNCQIFKVSVELSNTARATVFRGEADEWNRQIGLKGIEFKNQIEGAGLFGFKSTVNGKRYTEGVIGHIIKNEVLVSTAVDFAYTSGKPYYRSMALAEFTYDRMLKDLQILNDPALGTGGDKLTMASRAIMTHFNQLADAAGFISLSIDASESRRNVTPKNGQFGHQITQIQTIHGNVNLVENPNLRDESDRLMVFLDPTKVLQRPLVGNGVNRDSKFEDNIQARGEDARRGQWIAELGWEISLPENLMLYHLETA